MLGTANLFLGDYAVANECFEENLSQWRVMGNRRNEASALCSLGMVALYQIRHEQAARLLLESLTLFHEFQDTLAISLILTGFADIARLQGQMAHAARLLGAAEVLVAATGSLDAVGGSMLVGTHRRIEYERLVARVRSQLGGLAFATARAEGSAMTLEQAIALALSEPAQTAEGSDATKSFGADTQKEYGGLTARELEVAALVGQGMSNREVAEQLVVSEHTVEAHIGHIFNKLNFTTRTQIRKWAREKGLK